MKPLNDDYFQNKIVAILGEFFSMNNTNLRENILNRGATIHPKVTVDTDIIVCEKFPDWILVEQARLKGVKVIFVDRTGDLFSVVLSRMNEGKSFTNHKEPLGV